jgi:molybdenum cofactor cytidylyltransferase
MSLAGAVLAAGASTRLGQPKQLLSAFGQPLVARALQQLRAAGCAPVAVVLGSGREPIARLLSEMDAELLDNPDWEEGIASSLRVAVRWAAALGREALVLAVCDQPLLSAAHLLALQAAWRARACSAVASGYCGRRGVPALFPCAWFPRLLSLQGDRGAAVLLQDDPEVAVVDWPDGAFDVDTTADLARLV